MSVYVNQILNLKKIKAIGFDSDYTLVRYKTEKFEQLAFEKVKEKLLSEKNYPQKISELEFDHQRVVRGVAIDDLKGNIVQANLYGMIKTAYHGTKLLSYKEIQGQYRQEFIDFNDPNFLCIDTAFSFSECVLYAKLVDCKDENSELGLPSYQEMRKDVRAMLDLCHADGSILDIVRNEKETYIERDPNLVKTLEAFKAAGKILFVITNAQDSYARELLSYAIDPYLSEGQTWQDLFQVVITKAQKPSFFYNSHPFEFYSPEERGFKTFHGKIEKGVFKGGYAQKLMNDLNLNGPDILYVGDHIFGDVLTLKKHLGWRTALIIDEIEQEKEAILATTPLKEELERKMKEKAKLEDAFQGQNEKKEDKKEFKDKLQEIDKELKQLIQKKQAAFNPYWGEIMRAGLEESRFAGQVVKYACLYLSRVSNFGDHGPRKYFRPSQRILPHELDS